MAWRSVTRSLGLDIGDKRIGVALSDPDGILASPFTIINCKDDATDVEAIIDIINQQKIGHIIIGLPRLMNGSLGKQAEKVQVFAEKIRKYTEIPIEFRDERLTTVSARRLMRATNAKKVEDDAVAAALILQGYLDEKH